MQVVKPAGVKFPNLPALVAAIMVVGIMGVIWYAHMLPSSVQTQLTAVDKIVAVQAAGIVPCYIEPGCGIDAAAGETAVSRQFVYFTPKGTEVRDRMTACSAHEAGLYDAVKADEALELWKQVSVTGFQAGGMEDEQLALHEAGIEKAHWSE